MLAFTSRELVYVSRLTDNLFILADTGREFVYIRIY